jgi:hypothetical protein
VSAPTVSYLVWGLLGGAGALLWWMSRARPGPRSVATPYELLARLASGPVVRIALVLALMWTGWHLFAR